MTIIQSERFYSKDLKKYELDKNKNFLEWFQSSIKKGYNAYVNLDTLQYMVDFITEWYEIKYPEKEMEYYEGWRYPDFEDIKSISKFMDINQLIYRLPNDLVGLMRCNYRSGGWGTRDILDKDGNIIGYKECLFMPIIIEENNNKIKNKFLIHATTDSGQVNIDCELKNFINNESIILDELLVLFQKKYNKKLDFSTLKECIFDHNCDMELRKRILQIVALKLLYSNNTTPERGYERAKRFINEINKNLGLSLTSKEIDLIMNADYTSEKKLEDTPKDKTKRLFKKN